MFSRFHGWLIDHLLLGACLLILMDVATLVLAVVIALNQNAINDKLHDGLCRNSRVLIQVQRTQIDQAQNSDLYRQFFPQIPPEQLEAVTNQQVKQARQTIVKLRDNCAAA